MKDYTLSELRAINEAYDEIRKLGRNEYFHADGEYLKKRYDEFNMKYFNGLLPKNLRPKLVSFGKRGRIGDFSVTRRALSGGGYIRSCQLYRSMEDT